MSETPRIAAERSLFRPEVFENQRLRAFGDPVDTRPLSPFWCAVPAILLVAVYWLFASATYRPRAKGTASMGRGAHTVVISISDRPELADHVRRGDRVTFRAGSGSRSHAMVVHRKQVGPCGPSARCVELEGPVDSSPLLSLDGAVPAEVLLSPRAVVE